jgi:hypothetical protein
MVEMEEEKVDKLCCLNHLSLTDNVIYGGGEGGRQELRERFD